MKTPNFRLVLLCAVLTPVAMSGCDDGTENASAKTRQAPAVARTRQAPAAAKAPAAAEGAAVIAEARLRTKEICDELFAPKDVAAVSGLDVAGLETEVEKKGCSIGGGGAPVRLNLSIPFVKDKVERAEGLFDRITESRTKADIEAVMLASAKQADKRDPTKKADLDAVAGIPAGMPAAIYVDVDGVGDRARLLTQSLKIRDTAAINCEMHVLVRNVVFSITASGEALNEEATVASLTKLAASVGSKIAGM